MSQSKSQPKTPKSKPSKPKSSSTKSAKTAPSSKGSKTKTRGLELSAELSGFGYKASGSLKYRSEPNNNSVASGPVFCKEEPIGDISCPGAGQVVIFNAHTFQPGMDSMFGWLSTMAKGFQRYRVRRAGYRFVPFVGVFSDQGKQGKVSLFFDYDISAPVPTLVATVENSKPSLSGEITMWKEVNYLELNPVFMMDAMPRGKLVRQNDANNNLNLQNYDSGKLVVCMSKFGSAGPIGTLYVVYEVELMIPQPGPDQAAPEISNQIDGFGIVFTGAEAVAQLNGAFVGSTAIKWGAGVAGYNAGNVKVDSSGFFTLAKGYYVISFQNQVGDPTAAGNAIVQNRLIYATRPSNTNSVVYGTYVPAACRGLQASFVIVMGVTGTTDNSLGILQYGLTGETIVSAVGYVGSITFVQLS